MITEDTIVEDMLEKYPKANRYLMKKGIICVQCGEVFWGTLGELIREKGLDSKQILQDLNNELKTNNS